MIWSRLKKMLVFFLLFALGMLNGGTTAIFGADFATASSVSNGAASEMLPSDDVAESPYRLVWDSPSTDWNGTVPLGNGEVGVNVWFDASTSTLKLLVARTDSWDDYGRLVKLGEVDVAVNDFEKNDFNVETTPFRQILDVEEGVVTFAFGSAGNEVRLRVWVDTARPNVVVEIESDVEIAPKATLNVWRTEDRLRIEKAEVSDLFWGRGPVDVFPDSLLDPDRLKAKNRIGVYHRNVKTPFFDEIDATQGLDDLPGRCDPFENRTFGLLVSCDSGIWRDATTLDAKPGKSRTFEIAAYTAQTADFNEWFDEILRIADAAQEIPLETRREETVQYWREFAKRSWVCFSANEKALKEAGATDVERAKIAAETADVNRAYALQRYVAGCQGRGNFPMKFNGGLFTVERADGGAGGPDYRRWGPGYWFQNTRLPYYPALTAGDFDLIGPFLKMYSELVPVCEFRAKKYFGFENSAYFPECIYFWGAVFPETYGLEPWTERADKLQASGWHKWEWVGGLEVALIMLQYCDYANDDRFLIETAIPTSTSVLRFFDDFYRVDAASGKWKMNPSQALETWWDCDDPAPEIAGIRTVAERLLALPETKTTPENRAFWSEILAKTPEIPTRVDEETGETMLAPAARFAYNSNIETPELYPVFPFRQFSFDKPNADWARLALERRLNRGSNGWRQEDVFYAWLGDAENACALLVPRARAKNAESRFPAFFGPNYDWTPDQDHGGILLTAVQSLILQTSGDKIFVGPALPKYWDVEFKLWAPNRTAVEGKIIDGKVAELNVEPKERRSDVETFGR